MRGTSWRGREHLQLGGLKIRATSGVQSFVRQRGHENVSWGGYAAELDLLYKWRMTIGLARLIISTLILLAPCVCAEWRVAGWACSRIKRGT